MGAGGKERVILHLARELHSRGLEPTVICLEKKGAFGEQCDELGIRIESLNSGENRDLGALWRLVKLLRELRPDVINVHDCSSLPYAVLANRLTGSRPVVMTCHGLLFHQRRRAKLVQRLAVRDVHAVTAVSEKVAREYAKWLGISKEVTIIENGVPVRSPRAELRAKVRRELKLRDDTFAFIAVGNVKPEKGYEDLVEACHILRRQASGRRLFVAVAGDADDEEYLARLEAKLIHLKLVSAVKFLGYREDTVALYSAADAFVLPSRTEGLPMVLLEAMSMGLPVVASAVGGVPKVLEAPDVGVLVEPASPASLADGMKGLISNPDLCKRLGRGGAALIRKRYAVKEMARNYLLAFLRAVGGGGGISRRNRRCIVCKPKVVMVGPVPPPMGGMGSVVVNLRDSELSRRCGLTVMNNAKTTREGRPLFVGIGAQIRLLRRLVGHILRGRGQIVHVHTCSGFIFWRDCLHAAAARLLGSRVVLHVHGGSVEDFAAGQGRIARGAMRLAFERVSAVIVLSRDWVSRLGPYGPCANWRAVPNGVPVPVKTAAVESRKPVFLFLGDLGEGKGVRDLVKAASVALRRGFGGRVDLAGRETQAGEKESLERLIAEVGCESVVRLVGVLSGKPKAQALLSSACLVLPSYAEGLPMAILEAMACGLPIIGTKVGAIPEVIREGVEGLLVEPGDVEGLADRMVRVSQDMRLRRRMGKAARLRVRQHYSLQVMVKRIMEVYRDVLDEAVI